MTTCSQKRHTTTFEFLRCVHRSESMVVSLISFPFLQPFLVCLCIRPQSPTFLRSGFCIEQLWHIHKMAMTNPRFFSSLPMMRKTLNHPLPHPRLLRLHRHQCLQPSHLPFPQIRPSRPKSTPFTRHMPMGVLTDLHIHRFQHLATHTALGETPIGHQPLTDTLPQPVQRIIAIYHNNLQRAQQHTRLALNAIDALARFPPAAYFTDPNLSTPTPTQPASSPSHIEPLRFYPLPTTTNNHSSIHDATTQTHSPWMSVLDNPFPAPHLNQSQQTTPRPTTHHRHTQTDINGIVHLPAFAGIPATPPSPEQSASSNTTANIPSTTSPSLTAAANKQPHERWQYVNLIPTPTVTTPAHPELTQDFPAPIGGTPRNKRSKTPTTFHHPYRTRQPDPRSGSPVPTPTASRPTPQQFLPTVQPLPKHPPPTLLPTHQAPAINQPLQPVPPATGWPIFQGATPQPTPASAPPQASPPQAHAWPSHYPVQPSQQPPAPLAPEYTTPPPTSAPAATVLYPLPPGYYDAQGRPLPLHLQNYEPEHDPWHADNH